MAIFLSVLGPDGSGKSSAISGIQEQLEERGCKTHYIHLRPRFFKIEDAKKQPVVDDPHGMPPRGVVASILKLLFFLMVYNIGYLTSVRKLTKSGTVVIFDRYFHDLEVDPLRYRYGGSLRLVRFIGCLIKKPDLWILLNADPDTIQRRKQEVPREESERQCKEYKDLVSRFDNSVVVDANRSLDHVVNVCVEHVANLLQRSH